MSDISSSKDEILPQHFTLFVELFFAVVIGAGLIELNEYLFPPKFDSPSFWGILSVYFAAITSWIGWHSSTSRYPYTNSLMGHLRSVLDGIAVATYVALMYFASKTALSFSPEINSKGWLSWYLFGFVVTFVLYFAIGTTRRKEHATKKASQLSKIVIHGSIIGTILISYVVLWKLFPETLLSMPIAVSWIILFSPLGVMISYRYFREWRGLPLSVTKNKKVLAIDMDGVLVEQVIPVLNKVNVERGLALQKSDITDWEYRFEDTDIKIEILKAQQSEEFVNAMPPMPGMQEAMEILSRKYDIIIVTSRDERTAVWNENWLNKHDIKYKYVINTHTKKVPEANVIIDDYIGNILTFLQSGDEKRQAILFAQPWNTDTSTINDLISSGRIKIAHSWNAVLSLLN